MHALFVVLLALALMAVAFLVGFAIGVEREWW